MSRSSPRKVLLVLTDTQPTWFVGSYGNGPVAGTPNLDRLAADGLQFDRAYTSCPLCTPARSAIFSGLQPASNGAIANETSPARHIPLLGERLAQAGIRYGYTGKWHLDGAGYYGSGRPDGGAPDRWWYDGRRYLEEVGEERYRELSSAAKAGDAGRLEELGLREEECWGYQVVERARDFLEHAPREEDFVFVVSFDEPHGPFICPPQFFRQFETTPLPAPATHGEPQERGVADTRPKQQRQQSKEFPVGSAEEYAQERVKHMACNAWLDTQIGRLLDAVHATHGEDVLVIFTSDHGDMHGAHGLRTKGAMMYEETTRVPFLLRHPSLRRTGRERLPVSHLDITPTILDYLGIPVPAALHGYSLMPVLRGERSGYPQYRMLQFSRFGTFHQGLGEWYPIRCLVGERWKLVVNLFDMDELYDLEQDPGEEHNLLYREEGAVKHAAPAVPPELRTELVHALTHEMERTFDPRRGGPWRTRAWIPPEERVPGKPFFGANEGAPPRLW